MPVSHQLNCNETDKESTDYQDIMKDENIEPVEKKKNVNRTGN